MPLTAVHTIHTCLNCDRHKNMMFDDSKEKIPRCIKTNINASPLLHGWQQRQNQQVQCAMNRLMKGLVTEA